MAEARARASASRCSTIRNGRIFISSTAMCCSVRATCRRAEQKYRDALSARSGLRRRRSSTWATCSAIRDASEEALVAYGAADRAQARLPGGLPQPCRASETSRQYRRRGAREYARIEDAVSRPGRGASTGAHAWSTTPATPPKRSAVTRSCSRRIPRHAHGLQRPRRAAARAIANRRRRSAHFERCLAADPEHRRRLANAAAIASPSRQARARGALPAPAAQTRTGQPRNAAAPGQDPERGRTLQRSAARAAHGAPAAARLGRSASGHRGRRTCRSAGPRRRWRRTRARSPSSRRNFGARLNHALLTGESGDPQAALAQLETLLEECARSFRESWKASACSCARSTAHQEGIARFRQALERAPRRPGVHQQPVHRAAGERRFRERLAASREEMGRARERPRPAGFRRAALARRAARRQIDLRAVGAGPGRPGDVREHVSGPGRGRRALHLRGPSEARAPVRTLRSRTPRWSASARARRRRASRTTKCR